MPISLENSSNIRVTYNTGSNYVIETVKSDLYVRDTVGTTSNLYGEPNNIVPSRTPVTTGNHKTLTFPLVHNIQAYYSFNNSSSLGIDSNPSSTKYNLTPTIVGGTGGYDTSISVEGASFQATNDGDYLDGDFPLKSMFDSSTTGISISFWVYKKLATYGNPYNTMVFEFYHPTITTLDITMSLAHAGGIYKTNFSIQYGAGGEIYSSGFGPLLAFETWNNFVLVITKAGNIKVYFNGVNLNLVTGTTDGTIRTYGGSVYPLPTASFPNTTKLKIFNPYASGGFSGNIDEFYVFNKELSQTEITSLYNKSYSVFSTYTLTFPFRTVADINNNSNLILQGDYNVNVGFPTSSVLPAITNTSNRLIPLPNTTTSTVSLRYHTLNPVKTKEGAQWTYSSNNPNVYHLGSVGIGTTSPEYSLDVRGFIYSSSGGYTSSALTKWSVLSDRRIKENIVKASYDKCLENVKNIELYNFNFKDNYVNTNDRHQLGFIAQEVQQIYPKAVEFSRMIMNLEEKIDDLLTLNTTQIDYTLYGAVKCLIQKLENIKIKMEQIKTVYNITT